MLRKLSIAAFSLVLAFFVSTHPVQAVSIPGGSELFGGRIIFKRPPLPTCPIPQTDVISVGPPESISQAYVVQATKFDIGISTPFGKITLVSINLPGLGVLPKIYDKGNVSIGRWVLGKTYPQVITSPIILGINTAGALFGIHCEDLPVVRIIGTS